MGRLTGTHAPNLTGEPRRDAGFSVLEALVAMAVLAGALLPLLALQGQFVRTTEALERSEQRLSVQDTALAHISALNLNQTPSGEMTTPYARVRWQSTPAAGPHMGRTAGGFPSRYEVTLYNVDIGIDYNSGASEILRLQGIGWRPTLSVFDAL